MYNMWQIENCQKPWFTICYCDGKLGYGAIVAYYLPIKYIICVHHTFTWWISEINIFMDWIICNKLYILTKIYEIVIYFM